MKLFLSILVLLVSLFILSGCEETFVRVSVYSPPHSIIVHRPPVIYSPPAVIYEPTIIHHPYVFRRSVIIENRCGYYYHHRYGGYYYRKR